jgi:hypothetical protein
MANRPTPDLVMAVSRPKIINPLRYREDEHHRDDGHWSESLEGERHIVIVSIY